MSTYVPIQNIVLSSTTASIEFSAIPSSYKDLVIVASARRGINNSGASGLQITINDDTGSNYSSTLLYEGSPYGTRLSNQTVMQYSGVAADGHLGTSFINFQNYANTSMNKTILTRYGTSTESRLSVGLWRSTAAIVKIKFTPANGFAAGSKFTLYGIGTGSPKAFGGNVITTDGTYWYHTFQSSGIFEPLQNLSNVDYLVVAGGGSGAGYSDASGGGGAGGFRTSAGTSGQNSSAESKLNLSKQTYSVLVGAGAPPFTTVSSADNFGITGSDSTFSIITSKGGGGGGRAYGYNGLNGGSGGGGGWGSTAGAGGLGTSAQGFAGGAGGGGSTYTGGGGGGAGAAGVSGSSGSQGGSGISSSISGTSIIYAGGGGGGKSTTNSPASGGAGGGGNGGDKGIAPTSGLVNTGGGGGGSRTDAGWNSFAQPGAGGSGIVIVRYLA